MATEIRVPTLGETVSEATIGTWFKKVGDTVKADEPLLELETDKVTIEVPAPAAGVLSEIVAAAGDTVGLGALLGQIAEGAAGAAAAAPPPKRRLPNRPLPHRQPLLLPRPQPPVASAMPAAPAAAKMLAENNLVGRSGRRLRQARPGPEGRRASPPSPRVISAPAAVRAGQGRRRAARRRPRMRRAKSASR